MDAKRLILAATVIALALALTHGTVADSSTVGSGPSVALNDNAGGLDPGEDPRSGDIIVTPNDGVTYSAAPRWSEITAASLTTIPTS